LRLGLLIERIIAEARATSQSARAESRQMTLEQAMENVPEENE
jgi:hypothetical protein